MNLPVLNIGFPDATKTKKPAKPKRPPSANPKKQDKTKAKPQNERYVKCDTRETLSPKRP